MVIKNGIITKKQIPETGLHGPLQTSRLLLTMDGGGMVLMGQKTGGGQ